VTPLQPVILQDRNSSSAGWANSIAGHKLSVCLSFCLSLCFCHGGALPGNNEAPAELTTANGGTFTSSSARLISQSRYSSSNFYKRI